MVVEEAQWCSISATDTAVKISVNVNARDFLMHPMRRINPRQKVRLPGSNDLKLS